MLQLLDVSVILPFKCEFRCAYSDWKATTIHHKTPTGSLKRASLVDVSPWILEVWGGVSSKTEKSVKVIGISNKLDGTKGTTPSGTEARARMPRVQRMRRTTRARSNILVVA